jgi:cell wall assembly regulator SMI1
MNPYTAIFDPTASFLKKKGAHVEIAKSKKASSYNVELFLQKTGVALPESFSSFHTEFADGFDFRWMRSEEVYGIFSLPSLESMAETRLSWERNVRDFLEDEHSLDKCIEEPFRAEAFAIWKQMLSWVPIWDEGNGDHFCLDITTGQIVYDQHDWFDGFGSITKTNGIIAGQNLEDFIRNWSQFCFKSNSSLWWGEFGEFGAIKWEKNYFDVEFYRGS